MSSSPDSIARSASVEQPLPVLRQLDDVAAPVGGVAVTLDQAAAVELAGHARQVAVVDAEGVGQLALRARVEDLQLLQHDELLRAEVQRAQRAAKARRRLLAESREQEPVGDALDCALRDLGHVYEVTFEHMLV